MKVVLQRITEACVSIASQPRAAIGAGLMILFCAVADDTREDLDWLTRKIAALRIFNDENGVMNRSITEVKGEILVVSQFTLAARVCKGNRPSYIDAARPEISIPLYEQFLVALKELSGCEVRSGVFGADMQVSLVNDGPVTIIIDTKDRK